MAKCKNCRNLTSVEEYGEKYPWCDMLDDCPNIEFERDCPKFEKMSNADAIRAMSDEELAEFLTSIDRGHDISYGDYFEAFDGVFISSKVDVEAEVLEWLKSEVKE